MTVSQSMDDIVFYGGMSAISVLFVIIGVLFIIWNYHMYQATHHLNHALKLMKERDELRKK